MTTQIEFTNGKKIDVHEPIEQVEQAIDAGGVVTFTTDDGPERFNAASIWRWQETPSHEVHQW